MAPLPQGIKMQADTRGGETETERESLNFAISFLADIGMTKTLS